LADTNEKSAPNYDRLTQLSLTAWEVEQRKQKTVEDPNARGIMLEVHRQLVAEIESLSEIVPGMRSDLMMQEKVDEAVLLIHGSTGNPGDLRDLARHLHANGYTICNILLPGHGTGHDVLPDVKWRSCFNEVLVRYNLLSRLSSRVHVVGFSFGAALALHLAKKERVADLVLLSPAINPKVTFFPRMMIALGLHRIPFIKRRIGWNLEVFDAMEKARSLVGKLNLPIYAAHCDDDPRIDPSSLRHLQRKARHKASRFRVYETGGHMIMEAHGETSLNNEVLEFLQGGRKR
jgi:carboxylesterase